MYLVDFGDIISSKLRQIAVILFEACKIPRYYIAGLHWICMW